MSKPDHALALVLVEWNDAWCKAEEPVTLSDVGATHQPTVIHTLGWVLLSDDTGISLANEYYLDTYRGRTFIPASLIVSVTPFTLTKPRQKASIRKSTEEA